VAVIAFKFFEVRIFRYVLDESLAIRNWARSTDKSFFFIFIFFTHTVTPGHNTFKQSDTVGK